MTLRRTLGEHLAAAARYAATGLTAPDRSGVTPEVLTLRDDVRDALAGMVRELTATTDLLTRSVSLADVGRDPVIALAAQLTGLPYLGQPRQGRPAPSERWSHPVLEASSPLDVWKGFAVHAVLALDALQRHRPPVGPSADNARWTTLGDVAVLVEAFAVLDEPLTVRRDLHDSTLRRLEGLDAALAVEAREVASLAGGDRHEDLSRTTSDHAHGRVIPVSRVEALPDASAQLIELVHVATARGRHGAVSVFASANALARVSRATAQALPAAAAGHPDAGMSAHLRDAAASANRHGAKLQQAVEQHRPRLATIQPGSPAVRAQAGELAGEASRRIGYLACDPTAALAASAALLRYVAQAPAATDALAVAVRDLDCRGDLLSRDRSDVPARLGWVPTHRDGGADPLIRLLGQASRAAAAAPAVPALWEPAIHTSAPVAQLRLALAHRRSAQRTAGPARPAASLVAKRGARR